VAKADAQHWRRFLARWVDGVARRAPWVVLAVVLVGIGALVYTAQHLKIDTNRSKMLSSDLPFRRTEARKKALFPQFADNLVLVVDAATPEDARDGALALAVRLRAQTDIFHDVDVPRADPFLEAHGLLFSSIEDLDDLAERLAEIQPFLGRLSGDESLRGLFHLLQQAVEADDGTNGVDLTPVIRRVSMAIDHALRAEPYRLSWQELMRDEAPSPDERRQYVLARPILDYGSLLPAGPALASIRKVAADVAASDPAADLRVRVTGGLAMAHEELQTVSRGALWIAIGVLTAVGVILWIGLGSLPLVLASVITLLVGLMCTAGFATLAVGHLNLISVAFGILYIGLGIDYAIHVCLRFREGLRRGRRRHTALREAAQDVGGSLVLCSLSTAIGFYAFVPTSFAGVSELGLISGTGMFISLALNLTLLPALLTLMPIRIDAAPADHGGGRWRDALARIPMRHYRPILLTSLVLAALGVAILPHVRFDFNPLNLRDRNTESVATFDELLETSETPPWNLDALEPDDAAARRTATALEHLPTVDKVITIDDFVPADQDDKVATLEDTALILGLDAMGTQAEAPPSIPQQVAAARALREALVAWTPPSTGKNDSRTKDARTKDDGAAARRTAAATLAKRLEALEAAAARPDVEAIFARLGRGLLATLPGNMQRLRTSLDAAPFTRADLPPLLAARWVAKDGTHRVQAFAKNDLRDPDALRRFVADVRTVVPDVSGSPVVMLESGRAVAGAFRQALIVALIATAAVLLLLLRDLRDVAFVLFPLLLAGVLTCLVMVWFGVPFNFANVIALPLLLGVGVDSGIHMVDRARHGMGGHEDANPLRTSTTRAVVFSALTTACSFGQLALSPHPGTASMGLLLSVGMGWTLLCTLIVIPALLAWHPSRGAAAPVEAA